MKYSIIIPTYNHCDDLLKPCIDSILAHTHMDQVELIICANGCTDNTTHYLKQLTHQFESLGFGDHFKVITHDEPLGFAKACNMGIRECTGDRVVLLNTNCLLLSQQPHEWLTRLNAPFESQSNTGITSVLNLFSEQTQRNFAVFFCVMIDRKVIDKVGMLDEDHAASGAEDMEYCWLTEQAGFQIVNVNQTNSSGSVNTGKFPLFYKGKDAEHDWPQQLTTNMQKLAHKINHPPTATYLDSHTQVAEKFPWLKDVSAESPELFAEVIQHNAYKVEAHHVRNRSVIDVGANMGMFSILSSALGATQVLACEPIGGTVEKLTKNVYTCGFDSVVEPVRAAITGVKQGYLSMGVQSDSGKNTLYGTSSQHELVPTITLAELVARTTQPEVFLKMDCEGSEYDILLDSEPHVFDKIKAVAIEIHGDLHPIHRGVELIQNRLAQLGFQLLIRQPYGIWWYDAHGNRVDWQPLNMSIELWSK